MRRGPGRVANTASARSGGSWRSWCVSTDPEFAQKAADIVGLYLDPPRNAVVLCVDEKPHIQALERAQGWLRLPNGRALTGFSHHYKRHGTTTLFAALDVATGQVQTGHFGRRRRREFLDFMNAVVRAYPGQELHVVLDNLNTHKPKDDRWLRDHPNVHFHFTPTSASWLNQVECWFSILSRRALKGASFTSPQGLRAAIDRFTQAHNQEAAPFEWTKRAVRSPPQTFIRGITELSTRRNRRSGSNEPSIYSESRAAAHARRICPTRPWRLNGPSGA